MRDEARYEEGLRYLKRGLALERDNRLEEAAGAYRQAVASNPTLREAHSALGFYYQRAGLMAKAADSFRTVANLSGDFLAYFNLGYVLVELERYEEALEAFQRCLELKPDDSATHLEIGYIHLSRGEFGEALSHLQHPLRSYPEDWMIHNLIGKCHLGLRHYDDAVAAFGRSLQLTGVPEALSELLDNIITVERHREFRQLTSVKDHYYAEEGVVYLGSAQDDGIQVDEVQDYHFTYPDIGTTLQRLIALSQSSRWSFTAIVSADTLSRPVVEALSRLMGLPIRSLEQLGPEDRGLLALAVAREAELLTILLERSPCSLTAFCLGLDRSRYGRMLPNVIGIAASGACSVPWEIELRRLRSDGAPAAQIEALLLAAAEQIVLAVQETPIDPNLPRQVRYYTRTHRRLAAGPRQSDERARP